MCLSQICRDPGGHTPLDSYVTFMGTTTKSRVSRSLELALDTDSQGTSRGIIPTLRELLGRVPFVP